MQSSSLHLSMAMAMDQNRLIGAHGGLPWHIPRDLKWFKSVTLNKPIIMGRKTFDSIGRPLPKRCNIVVSRNPEWLHLGCEHALNLPEAIDIAAQTGATEAVVIGGAKLCQEAMPLTQTLYLTRVQASFEGDTWLESFLEDEWQLLEEECVPPGEGTDYPLRFQVLQRKAVSSTKAG